MFQAPDILESWLDLPSNSDTTTWQTNRSELCDLLYWVSYTVLLLSLRLTDRVTVTQRFYANVQQILNNIQLVKL